MIVSHKEPILQSTTKKNRGTLRGPSTQSRSRVFFVEYSTHFPKFQHVARTLINSHILLIFFQFLHHTRYPTPTCQQRTFQHLPTMSETFLHQLLRVENIVQPSSNGECCIICLSEYGTRCEKIRLPCNHTIGPQCIAAWIDPTGGASNSCPLCRYVFFPAQPRPYLEHGVIGDDEDLPLVTHEGFGGYVVTDTRDDDEEVTEEDTEEGEPDLETIKTMCETYCYRLSLTTNSRAIELSQRIAQHILEDTGVAERPGDFSMTSIAAVSVFATSHLIGAARTQEWVSMNSGIPIGYIAGLYWYITHPHDFGDLIDEEMLAMINRGDRETVLGFLPEAR